MTRMLALFAALSLTACLDPDPIEVHDLDQPADSPTDDPNLPAEPTNPHLACPGVPAADISKAVALPQPGVWGGAKATAPDTSYWSGDGYFTLRVTGLEDVTTWTYAFGLYENDITTQAACERVQLSTSVWAFRTSTGCYELLDGQTVSGRWVVSPYSGTWCSVGTQRVDIDTDVYSFARIATAAWTSLSVYPYTTIPLRPTAALQVAPL